MLHVFYITIIFKILDVFERNNMSCSWKKSYDPNHDIPLAWSFQIYCGNFKPQFETISWGIEALKQQIEKSKKFLEEGQVAWNFFITFHRLRSIHSLPNKIKNKLTKKYMQSTKKFKIVS